MTLYRLFLCLCSKMCDFVFFFFKQKTAYEILTCDWSSDVCSSDLAIFHYKLFVFNFNWNRLTDSCWGRIYMWWSFIFLRLFVAEKTHNQVFRVLTFSTGPRLGKIAIRSEEHTSELQSHVRISYAVFCLKKKKKKKGRKVNGITETFTRNNITV